MPALPPVTGQPLCLYRLRPEAFAQLQTDLSTILGTADPARLSTESAAAFCLFASEWWRRNHDGGTWSWEGIQRALGIETKVTQTHLRNWVAQGLGHFRRPLIVRAHGTRYLDTLAAEAGFPVPLLRRSGNDLHAVFETLLRKLDEAEDLGRPLDEDALVRSARSLSRFPVRLRHEPVFHLTARFLLAIWPFVREAGQADDFERWVGENRQRLHDALPVEMDDGSIRRFVQSVLDAGREIRQGPASVTEVEAVLEGSESVGWHLVRRLRAPARLALEDAQRRFGEAASREPVLHLQLVDEDPRVVGIYRRQGECLYFEERSGRIVDVDDGLTVRLVGRRTMVPLQDVPGADSLDDLPWVFVPRRGRWQLRSGTGFAVGAVRVAIPDGAQILEGERCLTRLGRLEHLGRELFELTGDLKVRTEAGDVQFRIGVGEGADDGAYVWHGHRADLGTGAFAGWPKLMVHGQVLREVSYQVQVDGTWRAPGARYGRMRARVVLPDGGVAMVRRLTVAPPDLQVSLVPGEAGSGRVSIASAHLRQVRCPDQEVLLAEVGRVPGGFSVEVLTEPEQARDLLLDLDVGAGEMRVRLPLPVRSRGFRWSDGRPLEGVENVHVAELRRVFARIVDASPAGPCHLTFRLGAAVHMERLQSTGDPRVWEADLGLHQDRVRSMLARSDDLDASVEIRLERLGEAQTPLSQRVLRVKRYDWRPQLCKSEGVVRLDDVPRLESVEVAARPFRAVTEVERLPYLGDGVWDFAPGEREPGPWLITVSEAGWYRGRPTLWTLQGAGRMDGLLGAVEAGNQTRSSALRTVLRALAADLDHPDWVVLDDYLGATARLPAGTFDLIRELVRHPALCLVALRVTWLEPRERASILAALGELDLCWHAVPVRHWWSAFDAFAGVEDEPADGVAEVLEAVRALAFTIDLEEIFVAWLVARDLPRPDGIRMTCVGIGSAIVDAVCADAVDRLLREHLDDSIWPDVSMETGGFRRIQHPRSNDRRIDALIQAPSRAAFLAHGDRWPTPVQARACVTALDFDPACFKEVWNAVLALQLHGDHDV